MADTLQHVEAGPRSLSHYEAAVGKTTIVQLEELARPLRGVRIAHVNGTSYGGGVSELLRSLIPMYRSLGIEADWLVIPGATEFFEVTKAIHNGLQGADVTLSTEAKDAYLNHNRAIAESMEHDYDIIVVHDPQPLPILALGGRGDAKWVWRCHIDSSSPNESVIEFLQPFTSEYDALVFTMEEFVPAELRSHRHVTMLPAIDPLSPKNISLPLDTCREIVEWAGVDMTNPLITQVSRFDPWKDPLGVIEAYRLVKQDMPGTQLALLGQMALDDPEGWGMYRRILESVKDDTKKSNEYLVTLCWPQKGQQDRYQWIRRAKRSQGMTREELTLVLDSLNIDPAKLSHVVVFSGGPQEPHEKVRFEKVFGRDIFWRSEWVNLHTVLRRSTLMKQAIRQSRWVWFKNERRTRYSLEALEHEFGIHRPADIRAHSNSYADGTTGTVYALKLASAWVDGTASSEDIALLKRYTRQDVEGMFRIVQKAKRT